MNFPSNINKESTVPQFSVVLCSGFITSINPYLNLYEVEHISFIFHLKNPKVLHSWLGCLMKQTSLSNLHFSTLPFGPDLLIKYVCVCIL